MTSLSHVTGCIYNAQNKMWWLPRGHYITDELFACADYDSGSVILYGPGKLVALVMGLQSAILLAQLWGA